MATFFYEPMRKSYIPKEANSFSYGGDNFAIGDVIEYKRKLYNSKRRPDGELEFMLVEDNITGKIIIIERTNEYCFLITLENTNSAKFPFQIMYDVRRPPQGITNLSANKFSVELI